MTITDYLIIAATLVFSTCTWMLLNATSIYIDKMNRHLDYISGLRRELREHYEQSGGEEFGE